MWNVGVDTGGTFTDLVAVSESREVRRAKVPSTPPDFARGVIDGLRVLDISGRELRLLLHGTTVTTNAAITKTGARTALITTAGFRDVLELRRGHREELYNILWDPPEPLVPRYNRLEVDGRVNYAGHVLKPLDEAGLQRVARILGKRNVDAVAVCLINSYTNPSHERLVKRRLQEEFPRMYICISSEILAEPPEFERTATTVANAYLAPVLTRYLRTLARSLVEDVQYGGDLLLMHSGGGLMTSEAAYDIPVRSVTSGPAAGVIGAVAIGEACGRRNLISLDMGGTSCDIAVIFKGEPRVTTKSQIEWGLPVQFASIDLVTVGAGGGSIAWIDPVGYPRSGPHSAGADPGPACYGRGGIEPTNTDAHVILGRLNPAAFLGGRVEIHPELAERAVRTRIANPLGLDVAAAADGIIRISNATTAKAMRLMTIERGFDPREFSLIAFGGAGPLHAVDLARDLEIPEVIIPLSPGVTSALGLLFADLTHDFSQSIIMHQDAVDFAALEGAYQELERQARERLKKEGVGVRDARLQRHIDLRYVGQVRALTVRVKRRPIDRGVLERAIACFHQAHRREYRYSMKDLPVETYILRVSATGKTVKPSLTAAGWPERTKQTTRGARKVYFRETGFTRTRIYERESLEAGAVVEGPAIIEQLDSTTVIPPDTKASADNFGNLIIKIK